ncbi:MAG: elongation factor P [Patescibacteria group bacterium]|nr:elongation factor P [Patescibacteria group bacterium]
MEYTELKPGTYIITDGQPHLVMEFEFVRMQQRKPVVKIKIKNLISGSIQEKTFQPSDDIEEAEIERMPVKFLYCHRGEYWFSDSSQKRFNIKKENLKDIKLFLKPNLEIIALKFREKIFNVEIPIKISYKVTEAPPAIKGNTAQGGTKTVTIETGAKINTPLFINEGDIIKVNTQTGDYVERVEKKINLIANILNT